jgi:hypothetical protein
MKIKKQKTVISALFVIITLVALPIQNGAMIQQQTNQTPQIQIKIFNTYDQTIRTKTIDFNEFISLFEPIQNKDLQQPYNQLLLNRLQEKGLITVQEQEIINHQLNMQTISGTLNNPITTGIFFDLLNVFNGFGFAMKGEKTRSFLDLPVARFPFLNNNITALFTGFNSFEGNGFIFTLGTNGFRYLYDYDRDQYEFPHFPPINGWFIGYTGILLEATVSEIFGENYEGTYIIGIGMNVITLWNEN